MTSPGDDPTVAPPGSGGPAETPEPEPADVLAPAVVAVVVTRDPGHWFEEALATVGAQDYPALSVLVIDNGSSWDPTARIASALPSAYVRRREPDASFGRGANEVLDVVEGAAFYLLCHDDVALAPDVIRLLVEEAFRSNAGIVTPKFVNWDHPERLLAVGASADKTGYPAALVEPDELDQEQHDAVRDVFVAPGGCTLVRADLFTALGGFDPGIDLVGEDLDLSWRAQLAGARVVAAPAAVVRHRQRLLDRLPVDDYRRRAARHRLRTMLTCYGPVHRARVIPQALLLTLIEVLYALLAGRVTQAREVASAWSWNLSRWSDVRARRRALKAYRRVPDSEVRRLHVRGSARFNAFVRGQIGRGDDRVRSVSSAGRQLAGSLNRSGLAVIAGWAALALVLLIGSRHLLTDGPAAMGDLPHFPGSMMTFFDQWLSGWRPAGLGADAPAPTGMALLGVASATVLGETGLARTLLVVGALPLGAVGAWRLARFGPRGRTAPVTGGGGGDAEGAPGVPAADRSTSLADGWRPRSPEPPPMTGLARLVVVVAYLAIPLPYNAIAGGRWGGLVAWAAVPWLAAGLVSVSGSAPFRRRAGRLRPRILALGLMLAVVAAVIPFGPVVVLVTGIGLALGSSVAALGAGHRPRGALAMVGTAAGAAVIAVLLHLPWSFDVLTGGDWSLVAGVRSTAALGVDELLRFQTGPTGAGVLGYAVTVAALLPLAIGKDWRLDWAIRGWVLALSCWALVWAGQQPWFELGLGPREALLAPAALGLALAVGLGLQAFIVDLPGYRFGWRQGVSVAAAAALLLGVLPMLLAAGSGRWRAPAEGYEAVLGFFEEEAGAIGDYRVLWIGDPDALPVAGVELRDGVAYGTTDGLPAIGDRWAPSARDAGELVGESLTLAANGETVRVGRLLAPMGVRYVVVTAAAAPGASRHPVPLELEQALGNQLDLALVPALDPSLTVFQNGAWASSRSVLPDAAEDAATQPDFVEAASAADLQGAAAVLTDSDGHETFHGDVPGGAPVHFAATESSRWSLDTPGGTAARTTSFGWANLFQVDDGGPTTLRYATPVTRYLFLLGQFVLWALLVRYLWKRVRP